MAPRGEAQFATAAGHFQQGELQAAEALFKALIRQHHKPALCWHFLALIEQQRGRQRKALECFDHAVALDRTDASAHSNRGNLLAAMGRPTEALASFDKALALRPDLAQVLCNRGNIQQALGQPDAALDSYAAAIAAQPNLAEAYSNRANTLAALGRTDEALASYDKSIALSADFADALYNRGNALQSLGRYEDAIRDYDRTLAVQPDFPEALNNRGNSLYAMHRFEAALLSYTRAMQLRPVYSECLFNQGNTLARLGRHDEALSAFDRALVIKPHATDILNGRGNALQAMRRYEDALSSYRQALQIDPDDSDSLKNIVTSCKTLGRYDEALQFINHALALSPNDGEAWCIRAGILHDAGRYGESLIDYDQAAAIAPDDASPRFLSSLTKLLLGHYHDGWDGYEQRWRHRTTQVAAGRTVPAAYNLEYALYPERTQIAGRTVAVVREQGIGDEVMFASIFPDLLRDAASVTCVCESRLVNLFAHSFPRITFIGSSDFDATAFDATAFDAILPIGSLGHIYRRQRAGFPGSAYLAPSPELPAAWDARLPPRQGRLRIGISWRGGTAETRAAQRSLTLAQLQPLFALENCDFVSLQYGEVAEEIAAFNTTLQNPIQYFARAATDDFAELAGLIAALDLVVSVQNSTVHLCGALGKECLALLPENPEWRYGIAGDRMAWYDSVRLFRSAPHGPPHGDPHGARGGEWVTRIEDVAANLRARKG